MVSSRGGQDNVLTSDKVLRAVQKQCRAVAEQAERCRQCIRRRRRRASLHYIGAAGDWRRHDGDRHAVYFALLLLQIQMRYVQWLVIRFA
jgi:hypothetical protein